MILLRELLRQLRCAFACPTQRRLRMAACCRIDQFFEARNNRGSVSAIGFRPSPGRRKRTSILTLDRLLRWANSLRQWQSCSGQACCAVAMVIPPQPSAIASVAAQCRRMRSSITGDNAMYLARIRSIVAASCMPQQSAKTRKPTRRICSIYFFALPKRGALLPIRCPKSCNRRHQTCRFA